MPKRRSSRLCRQRISPPLAADLRGVWSTPTTDARLKKRVVRTVIHEVVADTDDEASEIALLIHWIGGAHTELRLRCGALTIAVLRWAARLDERGLCSYRGDPPSHARTALAMNSGP